MEKRTTTTKAGSRAEEDEEEAKHVPEPAEGEGKADGASAHGGRGAKTGSEPSCQRRSQTSVTRFFDGFGGK